MAISELRLIASQSGGDIATSASSCGAVWRSQRTALGTKSYHITVPAGLHIGIGNARIRTHAPGLGGFDVSGPVLSAMKLSSESMPFATTIGPGPALSMGLYVDLTRPDPALDAYHERILSALASHDFRSATIGSATARATRLLEPIDPWFQGTARDMVLEARGLELLAIAETWLLGASGRARPQRHTRRAEMARDYIEANLATSMTLTIIARVVGINVRSLTEAFRGHFGVSIAAYITRRRMQVALQLLAEGVSVAAAAYAVGYQPSAFSTAFRRQYGYSPSAIASSARFIADTPDDEEEMPSGRS